MEKTYSILFKKINYDTKEGYFFLKPTKVIKTKELNFDYSEIKSKYTDELAKIDNQNLWISDNKLIYGYNLDESSKRGLYGAEIKVLPYIKKNSPRLA